MNCLAFALRFWKEHPEYGILYNSDHCINVPLNTEVPGFLPLGYFGYSYFKRAFKGLLDNYEINLLKKYLK